MTLKEMREKSDAELVKHVTEKREELRKFRFGAGGGAQRTAHTEKGLRREIAQVLTELTSRNAKNV